jgi:hypothetical protein
MTQRLKGHHTLEHMPQPASFVGQLRPYQRNGLSWLNFMRQYGLGACLADDMGLGKCLLPDTQVYVNGLLQTAEQVWAAYASNEQPDGEGTWASSTEILLVNSISETTGQMTLAPIHRLYRQWVKETIRTVHLEDGSRISITRRHPLLTRDGWTHELRIGDYVCVPAKLLWPGQPADPDLVKFLAWQLAEGYELPGRATLIITQKDENRLNDLRQTVERLGQRYNFAVNRPNVHRPSGKAAYLTLNSRAYQTFLESKGYTWGKRSREKVIPGFIMQADLESVRLFLRHYFDAEGSATFGMRSVEVSTASPALIQQLAALLRRFGIWLRIAVKRKRASNGTGIFREYHEGVLGGNAARRFLQEIGFETPYKQETLRAICAQPNNTNVVGKSKWTEQTLQAYAALDSEKLRMTRQKLQRLRDDEVFYCRIKSIEEEEYEGWVYDFEVAEHHNFVANNILCHNTIQVLALLQKDLEENLLTKPVLLVCPTTVVNNWVREAAHFTPQLKCYAHHGPGRFKNEDFAKAAAEHHLVITSYALLPRDFEFIKEVEWAGVALDEAHNIKNPATKAAQSARQLGAHYRVALTGTPVENRLQDLWSIMHFLNPGYLGSAESFQQRYAGPIERSQDERITQRLRALTGPFILRRLKTDRTIIQDLPPKNEMKEYCGLTKEQAALYKAVVNESLRQIAAADGIQRRGIILATLTKLKQVCNHPRHLLGDHSALKHRSGKLNRLAEMLEQALAEEDRCLIFTQYAEMGHLLHDYLTEVFGETLYLYGGTPAQKRAEMIERFQDNGPRLFVLSLKAGGAGINLTRANRVFHYDRWWNPAVENQATDRAFRIGQTQRVQVHKMICRGTLEERVDELITRKVALAEQIVGSGESWLTELSTDELRDLLLLRKEAVDE